MSAWFVYMLLSKSGKRIYTGITTDVERRIAQHNGLKPGGAKATRMDRPWREVYRAEYREKRWALVNEHHIKQLPRAHKLELMRG